MERNTTSQDIAESSPHPQSLMHAMLEWQKIPPKKDTEHQVTVVDPYTQLPEIIVLTRIASPQADVVLRFKTQFGTTVVRWQDVTDDKMKFIHIPAGEPDNKMRGEIESTRVVKSVDTKDLAKRPEDLVVWLANFKVKPLKEVPATEDAELEVTQAVIQGEFEKAQSTEEKDSSVTPQNDNQIQSKTGASADVDEFTVSLPDIEVPRLPVKRRRSTTKRRSTGQSAATKKRAS